jgi:hypothetical protein
MSGPNGHAQGAAEPIPPVTMLASGASRFSAEQIKELVAALEVPFDPLQVEWRVMNTTKVQPLRGQVVPYADPRAYTDRLNALFTPAGWTRKYTIHTSANFERTSDQKIVAKVLVTCELTIFGVGSHSATGEEWADDPNAGTSAEAQAFKRSASCFGLGRYLYYFTGTWIDLDERKRPKSVPQLAGWATPAGWRKGLRPRCVAEVKPSVQPSGEDTADGRDNGRAGAGNGDVVREIEGMEKILGKRMYRGILKNIARVWNPKDIQDNAIQEKVLAHMQAAERGLRRAAAARERAGLATFARILGSLRLSSLDQVDNLKTLEQIVKELETRLPSAM